MAHIGVIRALEERGIPIDYVTGTSMGAIIGSLYAMGYTPDEMEALIGSDEFKSWYTGAVDQNYSFYFRKGDPTPDFLTIHVNIKDSLSIVPPLPTNLVDPIQMNIACVNIFARATAASGHNFDKLMVPFRCIASDVYNKRKVVFSRGQLGDAVRASMSFPFVFKPIKVDSTILYDGGIYDNFPADVMIEDFKPDFIIGSVVAKNPGEIKENDVMSQLDNLVMEKSNYTIPDSMGITLNFRFDNVGLLDFDRLPELERRGYLKALAVVDSIRTHVKRVVPLDSVNARRALFKAREPEFHFKRITVSGVTPQQEDYVRREFRHRRSGTFTFQDFKEGYFSLLSGDIISSILPTATFNPVDSTYDLHLDVTMQNNISLQIGGCISTENTNQIYWGAVYRNLQKHYKELSLNGQFGRVYNNVQVMGRIDMPTKIPVSFKIVGSYSTFDYYRNDYLFSSDVLTAINKKKEQFVKFKLALPFLSRQKAEFSIGMAGIEDRYINSTTLDLGSANYDRNNYTLFGGSILFGGNTLNSRSFATKGRREALMAQIFTGTEYYHSAIRSDSTRVNESSVQSWLQLSYKLEDYFKINKYWRLGTYIEGFYSSRNFSQNYYATMMETGVFAPTPNSKLVYDEEFRANQYLAAGIKPIIEFNSILQLRGEFYGFVPVYPIVRQSDGSADYGSLFSRFRFMGEVSFVAKLSSICVSAYANYFGSHRNDFNFGITLGWLLFNERFVE